MTTTVPVNFETVRQVALSYLKKSEFTIVERAYTLALQAHNTQLRKSGEPYIIHPLNVVYTLAKLKLDPATLAAAFLHDVAEDTPETIATITKRFGIRIAFLVNGVTNLDSIEERRGFFRNLFSRKIRELSKHERQVESLRKMLLATSKDIRIVLIKLADRLHNMETLNSLEPDRQHDIANETLQIYAPLANRLGIGTIRGRLEDLAFAYVYPEAYKKVTSQMKHEIPNKERQVERAKRALMRMLVKSNLKANINVRIKHTYSLYKKLERYDHDMSKIYDLVACRIIVETVEECYQVLGLIHDRWKPYEGRVKDYVANPKSNGYQSIHTTVCAFGDKPIEIQIRTKTMHQQAEYGIAAHWNYTEHKGTLNYIRRKVAHAPKRELTWINELARWQREAVSHKDFDELMKIDFFGDRVFVYTPNGDVIDLPAGATPIDFAYAIHTEVGNHLAGAKVNGKMVRLQEKLHSGDSVELLIQKKATPKQDWLNKAITQRAKSRIRRALRRKMTNS